MDSISDSDSEDVGSIPTGTTTNLNLGSYIFRFAKTLSSNCDPYAPKTSPI